VANERGYPDTRRVVSIGRQGIGEARDAPPVECASASIASAADGLPFALTPVFAPERIAPAAALPAGTPLRLREDAQQTLPRSNRGCVTWFT